MRWTLTRMTLAATTMIALAFMLPLGLLVQRTAEQAATANVRQAIAAVAPAVAVSPEPEVVRRALALNGLPDGRLAVHLPSGETVGASHLTSRQQASWSSGPARTVAVAGGRAVLQPVVLPDGRVALLEGFLADDDLGHGLARSWVILAGLAATLVVGSVALADRLGARLVREASLLALTARALGAGDLSVRVQLDEGSQFAEVGTAFNRMAARMSRMIEREREVAAEVSHRLRTPLTAIRLNAVHVDGQDAGLLLQESIGALEKEVDQLIDQLLVGPSAGLDARCDGTAVLTDRVAYWSPLGEDQDRSVSVAIQPVAAPVAVSGDDLAAALDALLGNVFRHTPPGTPFGVRSVVGADGLTIEVTDRGPGVTTQPGPTDGGDGPARLGSTGLGLAVARRLAEGADGTFTLADAAPGVRATLVLPLAQPPRSPRRLRERRLRGRWGRRRTPMPGERD